MLARNRGEGSLEAQVLAGGQLFLVDVVFRPVAFATGYERLKDFTVGRMDERDPFVEVHFLARLVLVLGKNQMASVAVCEQFVAVFGGHGVIVTAEAAGPFSMSEIIWVVVPGDFHLWKGVIAVNILDFGNGWSEQMVCLVEYFRVVFVVKLP